MVEVTQGAVNQISVLEARRAAARVQSAARYGSGASHDVHFITDELNMFKWKGFEGETVTSLARQMILINRNLMKYHKRIIMYLAFNCIGQVRCFVQITQVQASSFICP